MRGGVCDSVARDMSLQLGRRVATLLLFASPLALVACGAAVSSPSAAAAGAAAGAAATAAAGAKPAPDRALTPWRHDWAHGAVFYEVFVRSFADSDGDGVGDLRGLTERLDVLNDGDPERGDDLGVEALWLMPAFESPSYHGYDVVDYERIDAEYGSDADFDRFLDAAHRRGIRVIL